MICYLYLNSPKLQVYYKILSVQTNISMKTQNFDTKNKEQQKDNLGSSNKEKDPQTQQGIKKKNKQIKILSGFFPVFIYFSVQTNPLIKEIQEQTIHTLQSNKIKFESIKDKHITLTKTINILQAQVSHLHKKIEKSLKSRVILPIVLLFKKVTILSNFICLQVQKITHCKLLKVTEIIGQTIKDPYFQNPIYHISLIKLFEEPNAEIKQKIQDTKMSQKTAMLLEHLLMSAGIKKIKFSVK